MLALALGLAVVLSGSAESSSVAIGPGSRATFVSAEEGARILTRRDIFVAELSPFDRSARLEVAREVPEAEYLAFVAKQARDWTPQERDRLRGILEGFQRDTAAWKVPLPRDVWLVKTTGLEEGRAAYCRGPAVVLPENVIAEDPARLRTTVYHELFHVFSSTHPNLRKALYAIVGFELTRAEIVPPPALLRRRLTNPDAPRLAAFTRVRVDGKTVAATPFLSGKSDLYDAKAGGRFFDQMDFRLLVLDVDPATGVAEPALSESGEPRLVSVKDVPDYLDRVGRNTNYIIHPEEVLADNFVLLVDRAKASGAPGGATVQSPEILEKLDALLKK
jgi:hypothetical protein